MKFYNVVIITSLFSVYVMTNVAAVGAGKMVTCISSKYINSETILHHRLHHRLIFEVFR